MSHSVFKEYPSSAATSSHFDLISGGGGHNSSAESPPGNNSENVVIVLNKDGSVSVDQHALHEFLRDDTGSTGVSVVRVQSPTPSLVEELREQGPSSDEDDLSSNNGDRDEQQHTDENSDGDNTDAGSNSEDDGSDGDEDEELENSAEENTGAVKRGRPKKGVGGTNKGGKQRRRKAKQKERPPHVRLTVEQYLAPDQAKLFAAEILQYAGMSSGLSLDVDYDYQRFVVQNDHCYTPLTSPKLKEGSATGQSSSTTTATGVPRKYRKRVVDPKATAATTNTTATVTTTPVSSGISRRGRKAKPREQIIDLLSGDEDGEEEAAADPDSDYPDAGEQEDQSDEDYSASESENDRDSDEDFRVNSNYLPKKKKSKYLPQATVSSHNKSGSGGSQPKYQSNIHRGSSQNAQSKSGGHHQQSPLHVTGSSSASGGSFRKIIKPNQSSVGGGNRQGEERHLQQSKLAFNKSVTTTPVSSKGPSTTHTASTTTPAHLIHQRQKPRISQSPVVISTVSTPVTTTTTPHALIAARREKEREKAAAEKAAALKQDPLYSDMSSLFATPDIIKKVPSATSTPATATSTLQNNNLTSGHKKEESISHQQPHQHQQSQSLQIPSAFELEFINSLVSADSNSVHPDNSMETRKGSAMAAAAAAAAAALASDTTKHDPSDDGLDLNDTSLLDSIVGDEGLPEELLQHVAELVENKSLQEVIDKQVLGVEDPMAHLTNLLPKPVVVNTMPQPTTPVMVQPVAIQQQPKKESPFVKLAQQKQLAKQSAAAAASLTAPRKEPIKIVRSDGRVITLPPIEAPTTRGAKRRAQNNPETPAASPVTVTVTTPVTPKVVTKPTNDHAMQQPIDRRHSNNSVDNDSQMVEILSSHLLPESAAPVSARKKSGSERGSTSRRASTTPSVAESDMDMEFNSEDDPDRLWCICKQPHNNRFMICCDTCEDWFHGKCVNITKAMGQQMEAAGKEWTCPNCVLGLTGNEQVCMVCHRPAKPDSVYCSDECIVKHANKTTLQQQGQQQSVNPMQMPKPMPRAVPQEAQQGVVAAAGTPPAPDGGKVRIGLLKNAQGRVIVYHKKTKQCLSGDNAPFLANIKEWLAQNPAYAIVAPGSEVAEAFKAKQAQLQQIKVRAMQQQVSGGGDQSPQQDKIQSKLKFGVNKQMVIVHPKTAQQIKVAPSGKASPTTADKTTPIRVPRKSAPEGQAGSPSTPMGQRVVQRGEVEPIRLTVRKTLKEQLAQRMLEVKDGSSKLTAEEIEQFALDTEQEMFAFFSKDTGHRYKAKYRSLIFNIKDRKNETLFKKICEKGVKPYRLVRMSPEELASQELAKWRENENKHQLDMIKKSEMDLLSCAKSYVLKSHKGEEVMENFIAMENPIGAVVDDVTMLSGMTKDGEEDDEGDTEDGDEIGKEGGHDSRSSEKRLDSSSSSRKRERSRDRDKHRHHTSSSSSSSKHHHKRKRSRERSRDRSDRDKERTKSSGQSTGGSSSSKHKHSSSSSSSHHRDHHSHHNYASKEKVSSGASSSGTKKESSSSSSSRHHTKDKVHSIKEESNNSSSPASTTSHSSNHKSQPSSGTEAGHVFKPSKKETEESYDLIEKILQETSPELVAKLHEMEKQKLLDAEAAKREDEKPEPAEEISPEDEYDPESANPSALPDSPPVQQQPRGIWSGKVVYQEISQFQGVILPLYGETAEVLPDFPQSFEVQGRIGPEVVWDYLGKIKRSVNRDITVVRFAPRSAKEHAAYETMYSYFETKGRLGVLKPKSDVIKDFYLVPQKKGKLLPSVLLTLKGLGNYETKANCIVGIVVRATQKRPSSSAISGGSSSKMMKRAVPAAVVPAAVVRTQEQQYTPPGSPKTVTNKLTVGLPTVPAIKSKADDDEPYSPGGSEDEDTAMDTNPAVAPAAPLVVPSELQKEVERLNRQIEAQKNEIVEMLAKDPLEDEAYSPSRPVSPSDKDKVSSIPLANISIPSNLQEILASLKNVGAGAGTSTTSQLRVAADDDEDEEYNPVPISSSTKLSTETYKPRPASPSTRAFLLAQEEQGEEIPFLSSSVAMDTDNSGPSKLSHMTDAELMSLVPDGVDLAPPPTSSSILTGGLGGGGGDQMPPGLGDGNDEEYDPSQ